MARFLILNITGAAILVAGWTHGAVRYVFDADPAGSVLSWGVFAIFLLGLFAMWRGHTKIYKFVVDELPTIGLTGTVVGIFMVLARGPTADELLYGLGTALGTTLIAAVGRLWLRIANEVR